MAHHTYKTKAFVLDAYGVGEQNLYITFLTEELGLVRATAQSARTLQSRFRYHVQLMSLGEYSLVRGREVWRLTGAQSNFNAFHELAKNKRATAFLGRYTTLLRRLVAGEGEQLELFELLSSMLAFLRDEQPEGELLENLEYVVVLRTLLSLGYIGEHKAFNEALELSPITPKMLEHISPLRRNMAEVINRALRESHL